MFDIVKGTLDLLKGRLVRKVSHEGNVSHAAEGNILKPADQPIPKPDDEPNPEPADQPPIIEP